MIRIKNNKSNKKVKKTCPHLNHSTREMDKIIYLLSHYPLGMKGARGNNN
jgi:hypothetical protein